MKLFTEGAGNHLQPARLVVDAFESAGLFVAPGFACCTECIRNAAVSSFVFNRTG
jgi:hypothetical protein